MNILTLPVCALRSIKQKAASLVVVASLCPLCFGWGADAPVKTASSSNNPRPIQIYGELPAMFEANRGQVAEQVRFVSRTSGCDLFLTASEAVLALHPPIAKQAPITDPLKRPPKLKQTLNSVLRLKFISAKTTPEVEGVEELPGKVNYFIGNDPAKWRTDIATYSAVKYHDVYPGVDMVYRTSQRQLEYDLIVGAGANAGAISFHVAGSQSITSSREGDLVVKVGRDTLLIRKPNAYQDIDSFRQPVKCSYKMLGDGRIGFEVGAYDATKPFVIDPVVVYSTFLGGTVDDIGAGIAVDGTGNAYVVGTSFSTNFPVVGGAQTTSGGGPDVFVAKLNPTGNVLLYSTYVGGAGQDFGNSIAIDGTGNAYVTGQTDSTNFPTVNAFQASFNNGPDDAFVTKITATGNGLVYSTYLGGYHYDRGRGIAVNSAGEAYVTGDTGSPNFPTLNPAQAAFTGWEAFITKFSAAGNVLVYSTFLGGSNYDYGLAIALDGANNAYVTGWTASNNFPTIGPAQAVYGGGSLDAFVAKLNAAGTAFVYSTYLGGSGDDIGLGIAVDGAGNASVTGYTKSTNFPVVNPAQATYGGGLTDAFVARLNPAGNAFLYSTYLGGSGLESGQGITIDAAGAAYVAGYTVSTNFPVLIPLQSTSAGGIEAFLTKIDPPGTLGFSTYLGGSADDQATAIAVDSAGSIYLTGRTYSTNFPTVNPYQATLSSGSDAFVVKIAGPFQPPCVDPPNTTMVAWYPFDEASGTTAANLAPGNNGTLVNSPTHVPGKVLKALHLNGSNNYVQSPSSIVTNIGPAGLPQTCGGSYSTCRGDFSIDAWINLDPSASTGAVTIADKRSGNPPAIYGYSFFVFGRNRLGLQLADGTGTGYSNYLSPIVTSSLTNGWHHIAVTVSRRSSPTGIKWFDNGSQIGSSDPTTGPARYGSLVNNNPLRIGGDNYSAAWLKGDIDELEIFNRELTPAEVQAIFAAGVAGKCK